MTPLPRMAARVLTVGALSAAFAACGGSTSSGSSPTSAPSVTVPGGPTVAINNFAFAPKTVTVPVGGTVTWINQDVAVHDVKFASGGIPISPLLMTNTKQASYSHTFSKAGTYQYVCGIHPSMTGTVIVGP